jgi:WD40 repeat protein
VIVWDLRTGQQHATLAGHTESVNAVACTRLEDGTPIALSGGGGLVGGGEVIVWDLCTGRMQQTLAVPYPVGALCCYSGQRVAIGTATEIAGLRHEGPGVIEGTHRRRAIRRSDNGPLSRPPESIG